MPLLKDQVAIVTGAAQGIGLAIARRFVAEGAKVVVADLDKPAADAAAAELGEDRALALSCDVASEDDVDAVVARTVDRLGRLDVMVNNAGITRDSTMAKMSLADLRLVLDVHLVGTWLGAGRPARRCGNLVGERSSTSPPSRARSATSARRTTARRRPASWA